ncbi:MAG: GNAT family N-acetyltransferase [Acidobacteria bacterium]|nr:GNAT family N-acetyltransferase [Acidobacteriota bacterium]
MKARVVGVAEMDASDLARWSALLERSLNPYPFLDPRMVEPASRHVESAKGMRLVVVEDASEFVAMMPVAPFRILTGLPPRGISTENAFLDKESTWNHPLIRSDRAVESLEALFLGLRSLGLPRLLDLRTVPAGDAYEDAIREVSARLGIGLFERERRDFAYATQVTQERRESERAPMVLSCEPSFALDHASAQTRKTVAKRKGSLEAALGATLQIHDRGAEHDAIEQYIDLQASGWKGDPARGGSGLRVMGYEPWFREVTSRYRADNQLAVYALTAGTQLIYMRVLFHIGQTMFSYGDAYDERFAAFGPGVLGRVATINRALAEPNVQSLEPNLGSHYVNDSKLYPSRHTRVRLLAANGGLAANTVVRALPWARAIRRRMAHSE